MWRFSNVEERVKIEKFKKKASLLLQEEEQKQKSDDWLVLRDDENDKNEIKMKLKNKW